MSLLLICRETSPEQIAQFSVPLVELFREARMRWQPDPTFYPSPRMAMEAPPEKLAYVALLNPDGNGRSDRIASMDVDPESKSYGRMIGGVDMPTAGDE